MTTSKETRIKICNILSVFGGAINDIIGIVTRNKNRGYIIIVHDHDSFYCNSNAPKEQQMRMLKQHMEEIEDGSLTEMIYFKGNEPCN